MIGGQLNASSGANITAGGVNVFTGGATVFSGGLAVTDGGAFVYSTNDLTPVIAVYANNTNYTGTLLSILTGRGLRMLVGVLCVAVDLMLCVCMRL